MSHHHPRRGRMLTPGPGPGPASRKRKEMMDARGPSFLSTAPFKPSIPQTSVSVVNVTKQEQPAEPPVSSNRLLAGYMAYEFLTKGTLLGERFDPVAAVQRGKQQTGSGGESAGKSKSPVYREVAGLLKSDGAHVPGVVNPTQLARWLQM